MATNLPATNADFNCFLTTDDFIQEMGKAIFCFFLLLLDLKLAPTTFVCENRFFWGEKQEALVSVAGKGISAIL